MRQYHYGDVDPHQLPQSSTWCAHRNIQRADTQGAVRTPRHLGWRDKQVCGYRLTPGTTYYYTLLGILDGQASSFGGILSISTFEAFEMPEFKAEPMPDGSVHITIHDRGLSDIRYELIREGGEEGVMLETFVLPDSGTIVNYAAATAKTRTPQKWAERRLQ